MKYFLLLAIVPVLMMAVGSAYTQENMTDSDAPKFFAIQHAPSGTISEINETAYSLELNDVSEKTILFSDRPDRIVTSESTSEFIGNWSSGEDSFGVDPPNAILIIDELEGKQEEIIIELYNPVYEQGSKLKYNFVLLNTTTSIDLINFGTSTLLIDVTQVGDTISNLISQINTMKNNAVGGK
ncbi:MAG: hypothetical protein ACPKPY_04110 [Nitrososphaeraceae archaeon]